MLSALDLNIIALLTNIGDSTKINIVQKFGYRDFLIVEDFLESIALDGGLVSERQVDKMKFLFYELKERYDILVNYAFYIKPKNSEHNDFLEVVDILFMEYADYVFRNIEKILSSLTSELRLNEQFYELKKILRQKRVRIKKILAMLKDESCLS